MEEILLIVICYNWSEVYWVEIAGCYTTVDQFCKYINLHHIVQELLS